MADRYKNKKYSSKHVKGKKKNSHVVESNNHSLNTQNAR